MTRALAGLAVLDLALLVAGLGALYGAGLVRRPADAARLAGLALVLGFALVGSLGSLALMLGLSLAGWQVLALCVLVTAAGAALAPRVRGVPAPAALQRRAPTPWLAVAALGVLGVYLVALGRRAWEATASPAYDAWAFWLPKARSLVEFDGIDAGVGGFTSFAHPAYPPLVPAMDATAFRFLGSTEASLLPLQHWVLTAALVGALAGLLARRVPAPVLWPSLALFALMPEFPRILSASLGDGPLALLFALAAAAGALWLVERQPAHAALCAAFLAAAALAKPEGVMLALLLALMLGVSAAVEGPRAWRTAAAVAAPALLVTAAWRVWLAAHDIPASEDYRPADLLRPGYLLDRADRLEIALRELPGHVLEPGRWLYVVPLALLAGGLVLLRRRRGLAVLVLGLVPAGVLGLAGVYWISELPVEWYLDTSAQRVVTSLVFFCGALLPLLLAESEEGP